MNIIDGAKFLFPEVAYSIVATIYLIKLDYLNKRLLSLGFKNSFDLMAYEHYTPTKFFLFALVLFGIGCYLVFSRCCRIFRQSMKFEELIAAFIAIIVIIVLLILLFTFINNPILRAVLVVCASIIGGAYILGN